MNKCGQGTQCSIHLSQISCWKWFYYFIASCVRASLLATIKRRLHITVHSTAVVNTEDSGKISSWKKRNFYWYLWKLLRIQTQDFFQICEVLSLGRISTGPGSQYVDSSHTNPIFDPFFLRDALDEGSRSMVQWHRAILLDESHKLDPWLLDERPRPKSDKSRLNLHGSILEGNSVGSDQEKELKRWAHDL